MSDVHVCLILPDYDEANESNNDYIFWKRKNRIDDCYKLKRTFTHGRSYGVVIAVAFYYYGIGEEIRVVYILEPTHCTIS